jgi:hypothetical protein
MRLIGRRLALYALTFWVAITVNFLLPHFMPGNPLQTMIGKLHWSSHPCGDQGNRTVSRRRAQPSLLSQYFTYLGQLAHGNLGVSITLSSPVIGILRAAVPWTIGLIGVSLIISFFVGTLCGALLGWTRGSRLDSLIPTATFFQAIPYFFLATVMLWSSPATSAGSPCSVPLQSEPLQPGWDLGLRRECAALRRTTGDLDRAEFGRRLDARHAQHDDHDGGRGLRSHGDRHGTAQAQSDLRGRSKRGAAQHCEPLVGHRTRRVRGAAGRTGLQLPRRRRPSC